MMAYMSTALLGGAGHSIEIAKKLSSEGRLICFDQDMTAIEVAKERLKDYLPQVTFVHSNFRNLKSELAKIGIPAVDGILYDLRCFITATRYT